SRSHHLRLFVICLLLVVGCLVGFLFGVRLEAIVPATGVVVARDQEKIRAPLPGIVELGWYEAEIAGKDSRLRVRLDSQGNGVSEPQQGSVQEIVRHKLPDGRVIPAETLSFRKLKAGDELWPGQPLGQIRADDLQAELRRLKARLDDLQGKGLPAQEAAEAHRILQEKLAAAVLRVPDKTNPWLVLKVFP